MSFYATTIEKVLVDMLYLQEMGIKYRLTAKHFADGSVYRFKVSEHVNTRNVDGVKELDI